VRLRAARLATASHMRRDPVRIIGSIQMTGSNSGATHRKRFLRWQARVSEQTRHFSQLVEGQIVPPLLDVGFLWVDVTLQRPDWPVRRN
jgi:hypothetical protein